MGRQSRAFPLRDLCRRQHPTSFSDGTDERMAREEVDETSGKGMDAAGVLAVLIHNELHV